MKSRFTGNILGYIGINILYAIICTVTLGIGVPWAVCMRESWFVRRTVLDGYELSFDGTGIQLFANYIKWFLLTLLTLGIYSFWLSLKMKQWVTKHTHIRPVVK